MIGRCKPTLQQRCACRERDERQADRRHDEGEEPEQHPVFWRRTKTVRDANRQHDRCSGKHR